MRVSVLTTRMRTDFRSPMILARLTMFALFLLAASRAWGGINNAVDPVCQRGDIILCEDFQQVTTGGAGTDIIGGYGWYGWNDSGVVPQVDTTFGHNSTRSLKMTISATSFSSGELRHVIPNIGTGETIYVRYYLYFCDATQCPAGAPVSGTCLTCIPPPSPTLNGERAPFGGFQFVAGGGGFKNLYFNSWDTPGPNESVSNWRIRWSIGNPNGNIADGFPAPAPLGQMQWDYCCTPGGTNEAGRNQSSPTYFTGGRWYLVELYAKMNTPGVSDGEIKWWIDGVLQGSYTGVQSRGSNSAPMNAISLDSYFGGQGSWTRPTMYLWYDDFVVSTNPIGAISGLPTGPTSLTVKSGF